MASTTSAGPPYPDLFREDGTCASSRAYEDNFKHNLMLQQWTGASTFKFPTRYAQTRFRTLQAKYFVDFPWLRYSLSTDGVYCAQCHLFSGPDSRVKTLVSSVLRDWSNIAKIVANHAKSEAHLANCDFADTFLSVMNGNQPDMMRKLSSQYNTLVKKNRQIMISITEAIIFCAKQNIALRGHDDDGGNFKALLSFQAKHDRVLKDHLTNGDPRSMYLSPDIQNELIGLCGK
ncbi:uncharacterized protein LOC128226526 [Mya arenaria]|uniref:uncharacterized protein LOC128226526 n=1 Tax=Mya arenaria TaxID=6604 RepID=UPI0022DF2801|nr:uncharacterized protein LOC128226526 [Mya arenaria]